MKKDIKIYDDAIASIKNDGLLETNSSASIPAAAGDLLKSGDTIIGTESPSDIMQLISKYVFGDVKK